MARIAAVSNASLLTELEWNLFPLPRLFSEAGDVAEMSRDNVMSGQNYLASVGVLGGWCTRWLSPRMLYHLIENNCQ